MSESEAPAPPARWETVSEGPRHPFRILTVRQIRRRSPRTGTVGLFDVVEVGDCVTVIALTPERELVLVRQYRHGTDNVTLELPGGFVDAGEAPGIAAARELLEETGYAGSQAQAIGMAHPNPAHQTNRSDTWLIEGARRIAEPDPDPEEDLQVVLLPLARVWDAVRTGEVTHAIVLAALLHLHVWERDAPALSEQEDPCPS